MKNSGLNPYFRWLLKLQKRQTSEGGYILVVVMGMALVLSGLFVTTGLTTKVDKASGKANEESSTGFYAAEAGLNLRAQMIRQKFEGFNRPLGQSPTVVANTNTPRWRACASNPPTGSTQGTNDMRCMDNAALNLNLQAINNQENGTLPDKLRNLPLTTFVEEPANNPSNVTIPSGQNFAGLQAQEYRYDVTSVAYTPNNLPNEAPRPTSVLQMSFKSRLVPLFQFAAFYENDLDFSNPAEMNLNGPIHSNNNLYLNAGSPIRVNGQLTSALRMYRGEKSAGNCNTPFSVTDPTTYRDIPCSGQRAEITANGAGGTINATPWNGQIRPGIGRLTIPSNSLLDARLDTTNDNVDDYQYWNKADLRIVLRLGNDPEQIPASIEVVNPDRSINATLTGILNGATCLPASTNLSGAAPANTATSITVVNAASLGLRAGDPILIGGDFDENVIAPSYAGGNTIPLVRPLGMAPGAGASVRKAVVWSSKTFYNFREKQGATQASQWQRGRLIRMLNVNVQDLLSCAGKISGSNTLMKDPLGNNVFLDDATDGGLVWHFTVLHNATPSNSDTDVTATPPGAPNNYGVRLYNGARLESTDPTETREIKGLTIATDQAVYVQGDYNCSKASDVPTEFQTAPNIRTSDETSATDPGCGNPNRMNPNVNALRVKRWRPAAIMGDSLNVLSNAWTLDDTRNCQWELVANQARLPNTAMVRTCPTPVQGNLNTALSSRRRVVYPAGHPLVSANGNVGAGQVASTVINAAFLAGVDITGGVNGSAGHGATTAGGLNNYPRLHEDWQNSHTSDRATLTYRGSMVSLGTARRVNGPFCGPTWGGTANVDCNIYIPPVRNWSYDLMFNKAENLPPLTPRFVFLQQERFSRDFEQQASFSLPNLFATIFPWFSGRS
jgi:hypothetical protein